MPQRGFKPGDVVAYQHFREDDAPLPPLFGVVVRPLLDCQGVQEHCNRSHRCGKAPVWVIAGRGRTDCLCESVLRQRLYDDSQEGELA